MSQEEVNIEDGAASCIPDEILLEVFNYLNGKTLKIVMVVCKRWHQIITQSASTMKKLPFRTNLFNENPGTERRHNYHTAIIFKNLTLGISIVNTSLQKLELSYCRFSADELKTLLEPFKALKFLTFNTLMIKGESDAHVENHLTLRTLKIESADHKVLKILKNFQVMELEISDSGNEQEKEILLNFLSSQKVLSSFMIQEINVENELFTGDLCSYDFNFKLNYLEVLFSVNYVENLNFEKNFKQFLKSQLKSLNKLKVYGQLPKKVYKEILLSENNLSQLEIDVDKIPQEKSCYENLKFNHLKVLKVQSKITKENILGLTEFLNLCRNVTKLSMAYTDNFLENDLYATIEQKLVNLNELCIQSFSLNYDPINAIKSLKSFSVRILFNVDQWLKFLLLQPNLEQIKVEWMKRDFDVNAIDQILNFTKIKSMQFGGRFIANKKIYDAVKKDYKSLRILELHISNYDQIKILKFLFPLDKKLFNPTCLYFEENNDREPLND